MKKLSSKILFILALIIVGLFSVVLSTKAAEPTVKTLPASPVLYDNATLKGSVELVGPQNAYVWFKYGEGDKANIDKNVTPKKSTTGGNFSEKISNLKPETKYFFQACVKVGESSPDACDITMSDTLEFTTPQQLVIDVSGGKGYDTKGYELLAPLPGLDDFNENTTLGDYLATIFKVAIGATGFLAVVYLILGGIQYATTDAISGKEEGRSKMTNAVFGLILALSAYLILNTLNPDLVNFNFLLKGVSIEAIEEDVDDSGGTIKFATPLPGEACPSKPGKDTCQKLLVARRSSGDRVEKTLNNKLSQLGLALKNNPSVEEKWAVTEAWEPSRNHKAKCHKNGTCVDANFNFSPNPEQVKYFINSSKNLGLCSIYEVKSENARQDMIEGGVDPNYVKNFGTWISAPHFSIYGANCK